MRIQLERGCGPACAPLAERTHAQLDTPAYTSGVSVQTLTSGEEWRLMHRTARRRAARAARLGYRFAEVDLSRHNDAVHAINTSLPTRQGRPMTAGYQTRHDRGPLPSQPCARHRVHTYGVLDRPRLDELSGPDGGELRAYTVVHRVGELALISMILGHGAHLDRDIMYLLMQGLIDDQAPAGGTLFYNRHDSGTDGLRYYKTRCGFRPADVTWAP